MKNIDVWYQRLATKLIERDDWFNMNNFLSVYYVMKIQQKKNVSLADIGKRLNK